MVQTSRICFVSRFDTLEASPMMTAFALVVLDSLLNLSPRRPWSRSLSTTHICALWSERRPSLLNTTQLWSRLVLLKHLYIVFDQGLCPVIIPMIAMIQSILVDNKLLLNVFISVTMSLHAIRLLSTFSALDQHRSLKESTVISKCVWLEILTISNIVQ